MIRLALPNKGRLAESARELLERAGLEFDGGGERALQATPGTDFLALFVRAWDIHDGSTTVAAVKRELVAAGVPVRLNKEVFA